MGLMTDRDWAAMTADLAAVRDDNAVSVTIRRGNSTLAPQTVRVAGAQGAGQSREQRSDGATQATGFVTILGAPNVDIRVDDRFSVDGILYEVVYVHPNRRATTQARAKAVE